MTCATPLAWRPGRSTYIHSREYGISPMGTMHLGAYAAVRCATLSCAGRNGGSFVTGNSITLDSGGIRQARGTVTLNQHSTVEGNDPDDCEPDIGSCE